MNQKWGSGTENGVWSGSVVTEAVCSAPRTAASRWTCPQMTRNTRTSLRSALSI